MPKQEFTEDFIKFISAITNKRAKIVIEHIIEYGFITTRELETTYGYSHPPRAARDVREAGIPLETFKVKSNEGKTIAAYKFGDLNKIQYNRIEGRQLFSKEFKHQLYAFSKGKCVICNGAFEERYLQIDHKVPYQISGDVDNFQQNTNDYMLVCASCNRAKSWSCEHCENWTEKKDIELCLKCYWGNPEKHEHIALQEVRRLELIWQNKEVCFFDRLQEEANKNNIKIAEYIKKLIENQVNKP